MGCIGCFCGFKNPAFFATLQDSRFCPSRTRADNEQIERAGVFLFAPDLDALSDGIYILILPFCQREASNASQSWGNACWVSLFICLSSVAVWCGSLLSCYRSQVQIVRNRTACSADLWTVVVLSAIVVQRWRSLWTVPTKRDSSK